MASDCIMLALHCSLRQVGSGAFIPGMILCSHVYSGPLPPVALNAKAESDSQCKLRDLANVEHRLSPQSPWALVVGGLVGDVQVAKMRNRHSLTICRITGHLAPRIIPEWWFYNTAGTAA